MADRKRPSRRWFYMDALVAYARKLAELPDEAATTEFDPPTVFSSSQRSASLIRRAPLVSGSSSPSRVAQARAGKDNVGSSRTSQSKDRYSRK